MRRIVFPENDSLVTRCLTYIRSPNRPINSPQQSCSLVPFVRKCPAGPEAKQGRLTTCCLCLVYIQKYIVHPSPYVCTYVQHGARILATNAECRPYVHICKIVRCLLELTAFAWTSISTALVHHFRMLPDHCRMSNSNCTPFTFRSIVRRRKSENSSHAIAGRKTKANEAIGVSGSVFRVS